MSLLYPFFLAAPDTIRHAHNLFLQIAVDLGLPGLVAWLAIWLAVTASAWGVYRSGRQAGTFVPREGWDRLVPGGLIDRGREPFGARLGPRIGLYARGQVGVGQQYDRRAKCLRQTSRQNDEL